MTRIKRDQVSNRIGLPKAAIINANGGQCLSTETGLYASLYTVPMIVYCSFVYLGCARRPAGAVALFS